MMKEKIKKFLKGLGYTLLGLIVLLLVLFLWGEVSTQYNYNHKYSIAMPTILGKFQTENDYIQVWGLNKIVDDEIASLVYTELTCFPSRKYCDENRMAIIGFAGQISIFPYHYEYQIKYADNNKLIFEADRDSSGEIDFNSKKLIFTQKHTGVNNNLTRKIEVITDNKEIEKLEKKIISKYLKKEWFKW